MAQYQKQYKKYIPELKNYINDENDREIKQTVVNYIYYNDNFDLSKYRFKIIEKNEDMDILRKQLHFISPNYDGLPCLITIFNKDNINHTYMINRKTLVYNVSQVILQNIIMYPISICVDISLFDGTIIDGIFISSNNTFIITDVYLLCGKNMSNVLITEKMIKMSALIKKSHTYDINVMKFQINKLYDMQNILDLLKKMKHDEQKYNSNISKGVVFYPAKSGTKNIYIFSIQNENIENAELFYKKNKLNKINKINKINKKNFNLSNIRKKITYKWNVSYHIYVIFNMVKTEIPDVYKLYLINNKNENIFIDIAYIPTLELSKNFIIFFKNSNSHFINCKFDKEKNKWIPIEIVTSCDSAQNIDEIKELIEIIFE